MQKVILFDFDGTIADSFDVMIEIINKLAIKYKFKPIEQTDIERLRGETINNLFKILHVPFTRLPLLARDTKMMQKQEILSIKPIAGIKDALKDLQKAGYALGILTSNGQENVLEFLKKNDLDIFTYFSFDSSLFGKDKVLKRFIKKHKLSNDQVIYVGDEIRDIEACIRAGIAMVVVTWGFNSKEGLLKFQQESIIDEPTELLDAVNMLSAK